MKRRLKKLVTTLTLLMITLVASSNPVRANDMYVYDKYKPVSLVIPEQDVEEIEIVVNDRHIEIIQSKTPSHIISNLIQPTNTPTLYNYDKYNVDRKTEYVEGPWIRITGESCKIDWIEGDGIHVDYTFDPKTNTIKMGREVYMGELIKKGNSVYRVDYFSGELTKYTQCEDWIRGYNAGFIMYKNDPRKNKLENFETRGSRLYSVTGYNGQYPTNGVHTDGYWYVRGTPANNKPNITITNSGQIILVSNKGEITLEGHITDPDYDKLTVSATIGGKTKTISMTGPIVNGRWILSWTGEEVNEGKYGMVEIKVHDGSTAASAYKTGNIIVDKTRPHMLLEVDR